MNTDSIRIPLPDTAAGYATLYPLDCQNIIRTKYMEGFIAFWNTAGRLGLMDRKGHVILEPRWDDIRIETNPGVIRGACGEKTILFDLEGNTLTGKPVNELLSLCWGVSVIGIDGNIQVLPELSAYSDGLARCPRADHTSYVNSKGRVVFRTNSHLAGDFHEGLAVIEKKNGLFKPKTYGYLSKAAKVAIPMTYRDAQPFSGGLARVRDQKGFHFITAENQIQPCFMVRQGKRISLPHPTRVEEFHNGYAAALFAASDTMMLDGMPVSIPKENSGYCVLHNSGQVTTSKFYNHLIHSTIDDLFFFNTGKWTDQQKLYGIINSKGEVLLPEEYTEILPLNGAYFTLVKNGKHGVADKSGNIVIRPEWDRLSLARPDTINVCRDGRWGVMDYHGNTLYPVANSAQLLVCANGIVSQGKDRNWYLLDRNLRLMTDSSVKYLEFLWFGLMLVEYGGKKYIMDFGFAP